MHNGYEDITRSMYVIVKL